MKPLPLLAIALLLATIAVPASTTPSLAASSSAAIHNCENIQLLIRSYRGSAGAGHAGLEYRIQNLRNTTCALHGYPGVNLLDAQFNTFPTHVSRGFGYLIGHPPLRLVYLRPHGYAYFIMEWAQIPNLGQTCPDAKYLMITAPNDYLPVVTYASSGGSIHVCGGNVIVSPVAGTPILF